MEEAMAPLNPWSFHPRFQHITEQIFAKVDKKSLGSCREVSKLWQSYTDDQNILWNKIVDEQGGNAAFQIACKKWSFKDDGNANSKSC